MEVRVNRGLNGHLGDHPQRLHLERRARGSLESFDQQCSIAPDQKAPIRSCLQTLRPVRNRRVQALSDLTRIQGGFKDKLDITVGLSLSEKVQQRRERLVASKTIEGEVVS